LQAWRRAGPSQSRCLNRALESSLAAAATAACRSPGGLGALVGLERLWVAVAGGAAGTGEAGVERAQVDATEGRQGTLALLLRAGRAASVLVHLIPVVHLPAPFYSPPIVVPAALG